MLFALRLLAASRSQSRKTRRDRSHGTRLRNCFHTFDFHEHFVVPWRFAPIESDRTLEAEVLAHIGTGDAEILGVAVGDIRSETCANRLVLEHQRIEADAAAERAACRKNQAVDFLVGLQVIGQDVAVERELHLAICRVVIHFKASAGTVSEIGVLGRSPLIGVWADSHFPCAAIGGAERTVANACDGREGSGYESSLGSGFASSELIAARGCERPCCG